LGRGQLQGIATIYFFTNVNNAHTKAKHFLTEALIAGFRYSKDRVLLVTATTFVLNTVVWRKHFQV
jgi:hypothetical protein